MAVAFEIIEVVVAVRGNSDVVQGTKKQVAICKTAQQAQTEYVNRGVAAFTEAQANPDAPLKCYTVRPYTIDIVGFV